MRRFLTLALILAAYPSLARTAHRVDTLRAQFLFASGDTAYVRCDHAAGPDDSIASPYLGALIACDAPIWRFHLRRQSRVLAMGDVLLLQRYALPRRAADLKLHADTTVWDPLTLHTGSAFAASGLVHRTLFRFDSTGRVTGDLALDWSYRGRDLYVTLDTSIRFGDGSPVDAQAVKSSLERCFWYRRDTADWLWPYAIAGIDGYRRGRTAHIVGILPRSRDTLQFNLVRPFHELPGYFASPAWAIVKWSLEGFRAPVRSACGAYGIRHGDTLAGSTAHRGMLALHPAIDSATAMVRDPAAHGAHAPVTHPPVVFRPVALPQLLVLQACAPLDPLVLSFIDFALDRDGVRSAAAVDPSADLKTPFLFSPDAVLHFAPRFDLERAREARELIDGSPRLRVAADPGWEGVRDYVVNALNAWNCAAHSVAVQDSCDLSVTLWPFDSFLLDAYLETALARLADVTGDSLAAGLEAARRIEAAGARSEALRSLLGRLAEAKVFIVLLRPVARFGTAAPAGIAVETESVDGLGRPVGPLFTRRAEP